MLKKLAAFFLVVLILGMFLPLMVSAGHYKAFSDIENGKPTDTAVESTIYYEGIVPCGKKVLKCAEWDTDANLTERDRCKTASTPAAAGTVSTEEVNMHCQLCHSFVMIDGIIDYVLISIIPYLTVLMLVVGGVMFYFGGAKPELLGKSKTLFKGVVIGLVLIYGSYMIVGFFLSVLGAAEVNPIEDAFDADIGVFRVNCPIKITEPK